MKSLHVPSTVGLSLVKKETHENKVQSLIEKTLAILKSTKGMALWISEKKC